MPDNITGIDSIDAHIPYYLAKEQKEGLIKALNDFHTRPIEYFINQYQDEMLQGDGWRGLQIIRLTDGERKSIKGVILSNSCDISPDNKRELPVQISFAPLIKLSNYQATLKNAGLNDAQINSKLDSIKSQKVTNIFYIPGGGVLDEDYITYLGDMHSIPLQYFQDHCEKEKIFTLSMVGFYLFVFKLSVHFCRFHENVSR